MIKTDKPVTIPLKRLHTALLICFVIDIIVMVALNAPFFTLEVFSELAAKMFGQSCVVYIAVLLTD